MKNLLIAAFAFFCTSAFAVGIGNDNPPAGGGDIKNTNTNVIGVSAESRANALAYVKNINKVEVAAPAATPQPLAAPQPINVAVTNEAPAPVEQKGTVNVRTVPNVFGGNVYPTAPCMGSTTVSGSWLGAGASVGTSWSDHECGKRETARSFQNLGLTTDAIAVLCSSAYATVAPICKKEEE
jgi:hypothetical protein